LKELKGYYSIQINISVTFFKQLRTLIYQKRIDNYSF